MDVPQEILDAFIDEIACTMQQPGSLQTLTACALVNRSINHRCRRHLFFSIETSSRRKATGLESKKYPRIMSLQTIMDQNPILAQYVRRLRIDLGVHGAEVPHLTQHLPHILDHLLMYSLCGLETLEIFAKSFSQVKFSNLPTPLQRSLFGLHNSRSLMTLMLSNFILIPVSFITGFSNLLHLHLAWVSLVKEELVSIQQAFDCADTLPPKAGQLMLQTTEKKPPSQTFSLYTLNVNRFLGLFPATFLEFNAFSELRSLTVNVTGISDARALAKVMGSAANSLEMLDLKVASNRVALPFSFALPLDVGLYPSLRAVTFRLQLNPNCRWPADYDSVILNSPSETSNLMSAKLILTQYVDRPEDSSSRIDDTAGWQSLDDALNSRNFVCLSAVELVVNLITHHGSRFDEAVVRRSAERDISDVLPRLSTSPSVKVTKRVCIQVL